MAREKILPCPTCNHTGTCTAVLDDETDHVKKWHVVCGNCRGTFKHEELKKPYRGRRLAKP